MSASDEILRLFASLSDKDKQDILSNLTSIKTSTKHQREVSRMSCCPHCDSKLIVKNGKRGDVQKYKCKACCKVFTMKTGTAMHRLRKTEKFELYKSLMLDSYYPITKIAKKVGVSIQTAFDWRHKILSTSCNTDNVFKGITEIDDIWVTYSQKGRKGLDFSRKRGGRKGAGDNGFQTKLLITTDRNDNTDISLTCIGRLKKSDVERKVSGKFSDDCILVSDRHKAFSMFAKTEKLEHITFRASEHTAGGEYHVQNINSIASRLKTLINRSLKGVSTKYLQNYANR